MRDEDDPAFTAIPPDAFTQADVKRVADVQRWLDEAAAMAHGKTASAILRRAKAARTLQRYLRGEAVLSRTPSQLGAALDDGLVEVLIDASINEEPLFHFAVRCLSGALFEFSSQAGLRPSAS